ncbi:MAG TPA: diguanylate cyclase [Micromonosporaceae bacterium]
MHDDGPVGPASLPLARRATKRSLIVLSHAMERAFAQDRAGDRPRLGPALLLASFQHRSYLEPAVDRLRRMAGRGVLVLTAFVGDTAGLPPLVHPTAIPPEHPLAEHWALVVLGGELGTALVGRDLAPGQRVAGQAEHDRVFEARWTFQRLRAAAEAANLLSQLAPHCPPDLMDPARAIVRQAANVPVSDVESRLATAAEALVRSIERAHIRSATLAARLESSRHVAEADELTGLHNRRYLNRFLRADPEAAARPLAVLMIDLDNLKVINDQWGHAAGDAALRSVARAIEDTCRSGDILVRWGGDEFLVLLPGTSEELAGRVAQRIVAAVRRSSAGPTGRGRLPFPISVSVGVSGMRDRSLPLDALDAALRLAKAANVDRVDTGLV